MTEPMTDEQIENWRRVLFQMIGPYAFFMPREHIQAYRDRMQAAVDALPEATLCSCDPKREGKTIHLDGRVTCNKCHKEREDNGDS